MIRKNLFQDWDFLSLGFEFVVTDCVLCVKVFKRNSINGYVKNYPTYIQHHDYSWSQFRAAKCLG